MTAYIDLSEKHGHRDDHGFACGAEFNVKIRRRINIPDFVREQLSQAAIDEIWWEEAGQSRDSLKDALSRRYKWIGELAFVGRGPGWLAIEDTACRPRNWDTIGKVVDQYLKSFIKSMEAPSFWRDVKGIASKESGALHHATRKPVARATITQAVESLGPHYAKPPMLKEMGWSQREIEAAVRKGDLAWLRDGGLKVVR